MRVNLFSKLKEMRFISIILLSLLFVQCTSNKSKETTYHFDIVKKVSIEEMDYPEILGIGMQIIRLDSLFIINDFWGDSLLNVYDATQHVIKRRLISKGSGPDDMSSPLDIQLCGNKLYVLSRPRFRFAYLLKDSILSHNKMYGHTQLPAMSDRFLPLNDSLFVFSGMWDKRYALYQKGQRDSLRIFGEYPDFWKEEENIPVMAKAMFHQCQLTKHPNKNLFASASRYVLDIYSYDPSGENMPTLLFQKQLGKYQYVFTSDPMITAKPIDGSDPQVKGVCCTEKFIYLLQENLDGEKKRSNLLVIDWDGNPIMLLEANKHIACIEVNEREKKGYCIVDEPESKLCYFEMPD